MIVPESLFLAAAKNRDEVQSKICRDLNELHNFQNETVDEVFLEMDVAEDRDWRQESGLLVTPASSRPRSETRIWGRRGFRLFLATVGGEEGDRHPQGQLSSFGVSAFVAHQDIRPTREWQDEIENALTAWMHSPP